MDLNGVVRPVTKLIAVFQFRKFILYGIIEYLKNSFEGILGAAVLYGDIRVDTGDLPVPGGVFGFRRGSGIFK